MFALGFPGGVGVRNMPPVSAGDVRDEGLITGWERCPGEGKVAHSNILVWRIPWTEEPGGLQSIELQSRTGLISTHAPLPELFESKVLLIDSQVVLVVKNPPAKAREQFYP